MARRWLFVFDVGELCGSMDEVGDVLRDAGGDEAIDCVDVIKFLDACEWRVLSLKLVVLSIQS